MSKVVKSITNTNVKIYFSDYFEIEHDIIDDYGALDISLLSDNPAFVDPFLIFYSKNKEYQKLHQFIIDYLVFLKQQSDENNFSYQFYTFPEVKQVWLGFSKNRNHGLGLGPYFADELNKNFVSIFKGRKDQITQSTHLEKLCIVGERIGADKVSDFTVNLIKNYLVKYTEKFAIENLDKKYIKKFRVSKLYFDFNTNNWVDDEAILPINPHDKSEYVLLTPKNILVKEEGWISSNDFLNHDGLIINSIPNESLRYKINQYFESLLPNKVNKRGESEKDFSKKYRKEALKQTAKKYPEIIDYFIKYKEENGQGAVKLSKIDNDFLNQVFYLGVKTIIKKLKEEEFYIKDKNNNSFVETIEGIKKLKLVMEKRDGYNLFWEKDKLRKFKEPDIDTLIDLVFSSSDFSIDKQVNNGRGPSDIKVSKGAKDSTIIEIKLAKSTSLKKNLQKQLDIYKEANNTPNGVYVIFYFSDPELERVTKILKDLKMNEFLDEWIFLIDCRKKISASKVL